MLPIGLENEWKRSTVSQIENVPRLLISNWMRLIMTTCSMATIFSLKIFHIYRLFLRPKTNRISCSQSDIVKFYSESSRLIPQVVNIWQLFWQYKKCLSRSIFWRANCLLCVKVSHQIIVWVFIFRRTHDWICIVPLKWMCATMVLHANNIKARIQLMIRWRVDVVGVRCLCAGSRKKTYMEDWSNAIDQKAKLNLNKLKPMAKSVYRRCFFFFALAYFVEFWWAVFVSLSCAGYTRVCLD